MGSDPSRVTQLEDVGKVVSICKSLNINTS